MPLTVVDVPAEPATADPVVTITVQITVVGDELPPAASRLVTDLEALLAHGSASQVAAPVPAHQHAADAPLPSLRLVEPAAPAQRLGGGTHSGGPTLQLCTGPRLVMRDGAPVHLTRREFDLLQFFCDNPRRVFSRAQLLQQVWGYDMVGTERTVDVHVRRLRVKLGECAAVIATVRGVGYRLDDDTPISILVQRD
jgi:two-component system, OmpR family, response regulator